MWSFLFSNKLKITLFTGGFALLSLFQALALKDLGQAHQSVFFIDWITYMLSYSGLSLLLWYTVKYSGKGLSVVQSVVNHLMFIILFVALSNGVAYLIFVNIDHAFEWVYEQNVVVVYADKDADKTELDQLQAHLSATPNIVGVEFLSKDEILNKYAESFSSALFEQLQGENNPMQDAFVVTFGDIQLLEQSVASIKTYESVEQVVYNGDVAETLSSLRSLVLMAGGWIIGLLLLVSLFIISNTIKLTVYSRRLEIRIMKSVGATKRFIRTPFVIEGVILGLLAGLLTYGITYLIYTQLEKYLTFSAFLGLVKFNVVCLPLLIGFLAAGVLTGVLGSVISMGRYLREKGAVALE